MTDSGAARNGSPSGGERARQAPPRRGATRPRPGQAGGGPLGPVWLLVSPPCLGAQAADKVRAVCGRALDEGASDVVVDLTALRELSTVGAEALAEAARRLSDRGGVFWIADGLAEELAVAPVGRQVRRPGTATDTGTATGLSAALAAIGRGELVAARAATASPEVVDPGTTLDITSPVSPGRSPTAESRAQTREELIEMLKVMVALDESPASLRAAHTAARLFPGAEFLVVHVAVRVVPWAGLGDFGGVYPAVVSDARVDGLDDDTTLADRAAQAGLTGARTLRLEGETATAICDAAEGFDADVVVVGSHDKSLLTRLLDPSIAQAVVRGTHRPVLVVSGEAAEGRPDDAPVAAETLAV